MAAPCIFFLNMSFYNRLRLVNLLAVRMNAANVGTHSESYFNSRLPAAQAFMNSAKRRARVASFFALTTQ